MKRSRRLISLLLAFTLVCMMIPAASAAPAPSLTSLKILAVASRVNASTNTYDFEPMPSNAVAPSTTFRHSKYEVCVMVEQRGYESWKYAKLGSQSASEIGFDYIVNSSNIITGYVWYFWFDNVTDPATSSLFVLRANNINSPFNTLTTMCTINWQ